MKLQLHTQNGYHYFGAAIDAAIECYRNNGNALIHRATSTGPAYIYFQDPHGPFAELPCTGSMQIENYCGDQPILTAFIKLSGLFSL